LTLKKISLLKKTFKARDIDAYLVPSFDEFQNNFVPENLSRLKWLTSFTGSNGLALITKEQNYFFTDGRYITQALNQLSDKGFKVYNMQNVDEIFSDVFKDIHATFLIGYDPNIFTSRHLEYFCKYFKGSTQYIHLTAVNVNLIDELWDRPKAFETKAAVILDAKYTAQNEVMKVNRLVENLKTDYVLLTSPESICWLLNMRGSDLPYSPLIMCYCLISSIGDIEVFSYLTKLKSGYKNIKLLPFDEIKERIKEINKQHKTIEYDASKTPIWFIQNYKKDSISFKQDPCLHHKAKKDAVEIAGFQYATIQDGVALTILYNWLEKNVTAEAKISEVDVDKKLLELKHKNPLFKTKSFETISSFAENSAIIHYNPYDGKNSSITSGNFYLLDCGSQYRCGTTDVTRTFYFGKPPKLAKLHYTLVLKGFVNLCILKFSIGTTGQQIDSIARQFLWQHNLDYPHSTGHGVGHFLSVHEGPQSISKTNNVPLEPGMVISIEPGYYIPNEYGIRIEDIVFVRETIESKDFLQFESLTLAPIQFNLIDESLLTINEKGWLAAYHRRVYASLSPFLDKNSKAYLEKYLHYYNNLV
jgi:Xaa-Pro aminopeptidase